MNTQKSPKDPQDADYDLVAWRTSEESKDTKKAKSDRANPANDELYELLGAAAPFPRFTFLDQSRDISGRLRNLETSYLLGPSAPPLPRDSSAHHHNPTVEARYEVVPAPRSATTACSGSEETLRFLRGYNIKWGRYANYEILNQVAKGSSSLIFKAIHSQSRQLRSAKVFNLVPGSLELKMHISILVKLRRCKDIAEYFDAIRMPLTKQVCIVTEFVHVKNIHTLSEISEIRKCLLDVLGALEFAHSRGVMHRNLHPHHILVDRYDGHAKLTDWTQAAFWSPKAQYSCDKGTLAYRAPEMVFSYHRYNWTVDLWSLGCIILEMVFKKVPFFFAPDAYTYISNVCAVLGKDTLNDILKKYEIGRDIFDNTVIEPAKFQTWKEFVNDSNSHLVSPTLIDLILSILAFDPDSRSPAARLRFHEFFLDEAQSSKSSVGSRRSSGPQAPRASAPYHKQEARNRGSRS